jgi:type VI protein secretion system component VasK
LTARLKHLCQLIARDRKPWCPINGLVLLIPLPGTNDQHANDTAGICQKDVAAVREVTQMHFPSLAVLSDMEKMPGFAEFVERMPQPLRRNRLGHGFPWNPAAEPAAFPQLLEGTAERICLADLPFWIYKLFRIEPATDETVDQLIEGNSRLYEFLGQLHLRQKGLGRILARAFAQEANGKLLFGGCYLAGQTQQAFAAGIFQKLLAPETEALVYWTDQAIAENEKYERRTGCGYLIAVAATIGAVIAIVVAVLHWYVWT